jgi:hypothetical protein
MATPGSETYAAAAERFFELMKTFGMTAGAMPDWKALAAPLATQFERWLQMSQATAPWFTGAPPGTAAAGGFGGPAAAAFAPLPLGPAAAHGTEPPRTFELLGRLAQLQGELAKHWSEIAATAAQHFIARLGTASAVPATPQQALQLYELWVNCAEEAYGATVHKEEFGRLQSELANTSAALIAEQRRQADTLVRTFGLPTRDEVDALYGQVKDLRRQLAELATVTRPSGAATPESRRTQRKAPAKGTARQKVKASTARGRTRRPRR